MEKFTSKGPRYKVLLPDTNVLNHSQQIDLIWLCAVCSLLCDAPCDGQYSKCDCKISSRSMRILSQPGINVAKIKNPSRKISSCFFFLKYGLNINSKSYDDIFYVKLVNCPLSQFLLEGGLQQKENTTITYKRAVLPSVCLFLPFCILPISV